MYRISLPSLRPHMKQVPHHDRKETSPKHNQKPAPHKIPGHGHRRPLLAQHSRPKPRRRGPRAAAKVGTEHASARPATQPALSGLAPSLGRGWLAVTASDPRDPVEPKTAPNINATSSQGRCPWRACGSNGQAVPERVWHLPQRVESLKCTLNHRSSDSTESNLFLR